MHRWAVAVDDERLVFADTEGLTIDPSFHHPRTRTAMCPLLGVGRISLLLVDRKLVVAELLSGRYKYAHRVLCVTIL